MATLKDLARSIASSHGLKDRDAELFITAIVDTILEGLENDRLVKIKGFGTFKLTSIRERESVNVNTGERVTISGHDKISFTPENSVRDLINRPFLQFETVMLSDSVDPDEMNVEPEVEKVLAEVAEASEKAGQGEITEPVAVSAPVISSALSVPEVTGTLSQPDVVEETPVKVEETLAEPSEPEVPSQPEAVEETPVTVEETPAEPSEPETPSQSETPDETPVETAETPETIETPQEQPETTEEDTTEEDTTEEETTEEETAEEETPAEPQTKFVYDDEDDDDDEENSSKRTFLVYAIVINILIALAAFVAGYFCSQHGVFNTGNAVPAEVVDSDVDAENTISNHTRVDTVTNTASRPASSAQDPASQAQKAQAQAQAEQANAQQAQTKALEQQAQAQAAMTKAQEAQAKAQVEQAKLQAQVNAQNKNAQGKTSANAQAKTSTPTQTKNAIPDQSKYNSDARVRTGAYYIIGVDQTVTARQGQTLKSISRTYLGPDMECYVEALNGKKSIKAGDKVMIPKLKMKKLKK